jgi:hypothetical protein
MTKNQLSNVDGACHCGAVRFSASLDLGAAFRCNCTICARTAATLVASTPSAFRLLSGESELAEYRFGPGQLTRYFCRHCGIHCFARGRDGAGNEFIGVNLNTVEGVEVAELKLTYFDGRHDDFAPRDAPAPIFREHRA